MCLAGGIQMNSIVVDPTFDIWPQKKNNQRNKEFDQKKERKQQQIAYSQE